jgi:hypothetical protein
LRLLDPLFYQARAAVPSLDVKAPVSISAARVMETVEDECFKRLLQGCCA